MITITKNPEVVRSLVPALNLLWREKLGQRQFSWYIVSEDTPLVDVYVYRSGENIKEDDFSATPLLESIYETNYSGGGPKYFDDHLLVVLHLIHQQIQGKLTSWLQLSVGAIVLTMDWKMKDGVRTTEITPLAHAQGLDEFLAGHGWNISEFREIGQLSWRP